jgi:hypothetical protein
MRILVTGSRDWTDEEAIFNALADATQDVQNHSMVTLVSGACPTGADRIAEEIAEQWNWQIERHPAKWRQFGKGAGFIRNNEMAASEPNLCLAFIRNNSRGATHCADAAEFKNDVPTIRYYA